MRGGESRSPVTVQNIVAIMCATCFNNKNTQLFPPHTVHLRVSYNSQNKQLSFFLNIINRLAFENETQCILCEVRTECVNIIHANFRLQSVSYNCWLGSFLYRMFTDTTYIPVTFRVSSFLNKFSFVFRN
jgi:hypothetical protein